MLAESQEELGSYADALSTPPVESVQDGANCLSSCWGKFPTTTVSTLIMYEKHFQVQTVFKFV